MRFDLLQYFSFKNSPKFVFSPNDLPLFLLKGHANILEISHTIPPSEQGKLKFFKKAQWYFL